MLQTIIHISTRSSTKRSIRKWWSSRNLSKRNWSNQRRLTILWATIINKRKESINWGNKERCSNNWSSKSKMTPKTTLKMMLICPRILMTKIRSPKWRTCKIYIKIWKLPNWKSRLPFRSSIKSFKRSLNRFQSSKLVFLSAFKRSLKITKILQILKSLSKFKKTKKNLWNPMMSCLKNLKLPLPNPSPFKT